MQVVLHRAIACHYYSIRDVSTEARFVHDKLSSCVAVVAPLTCVHIDVFVAPLRSAAKDKNFLGVAVWDRRNFTVGKFRSQVYGHRAPTAPEVYDRHAVHDAWRVIVERIIWHSCAVQREKLNGIKRIWVRYDLIVTLRDSDTNRRKLSSRLSTSSTPARSMYISSMYISLSAKVVFSSFQNPLEYFRYGPSTA